MILIVDDSSDTAELVVRLLRHGGLEAAHVPSAARALKLLQTCQSSELPSLMILDVAMPEMSGIDCLRAIRAEPTWAAMPVVMYTADFTPSRMQEAMKLGAVGYVVKGAASWDDFLAIIHKHNRAPARM